MSYDIMGRYLNYISSSSEYYTKRSSIPEKQLIVGYYTRVVHFHCGK